MTPKMLVLVLAALCLLSVAGIGRAASVHLDEDDLGALLPNHRALTIHIGDCFDRPDTSAGVQLCVSDLAEWCERCTASTATATRSQRGARIP